MSAPPYMQFYVGDYLADTKRLTTIQHGAYLLLLFELWRSDGQLPDDDSQLSKIVGLRLDQWRGMRPVLMRYFRIEGGLVSHKRLTQELEAAHEKRARLSNIGAHGAKVKALKKQNAPQAKASPQLKPPTPEPERVELSAPSGAERVLLSSPEDARETTTLSRPLEGESVVSASPQPSGAQEALRDEREARRALADSVYRDGGKIVPLRPESEKAAAVAEARRKLLEAQNG